jgi:hypothetical protein
MNTLTSPGDLPDTVADDTCDSTQRGASADKGFQEDPYDTTQLGCNTDPRNAIVFFAPNWIPNIHNGVSIGVERGLTVAMSVSDDANVTYGTTSMFASLVRSYPLNTAVAATAPRWYNRCVQLSGLLAPVMKVCPTGYAPSSGLLCTAACNTTTSRNKRP